MSFDPPILINCRDRLRDLRKLVVWLERAGHERITLLDNASTFEPLLDYLDASPHQVVRLGENMGSRSIWTAGLVPDQAYVFTDPDLIPTDECPLDAVEHLQELLERYPTWPKAALGLHLDDVPASLDCLAWERSLVSESRLVVPGVYHSLSDTTFALYRPEVRTHTYTALRCGAPYQCRHMSWYVTEPDAEDAFYLAHADPGPLGSSWAEGSGWADGRGALAA